MWQWRKYLADKIPIFEWKLSLFPPRRTRSHCQDELCEEYGVRWRILLVARW